MKPTEGQEPIVELSTGEKLFMHARRLIAIVACLIGAALLWWRCVAEAPPKKSKLKVIEGVVSEVRIVERSSKYNSAEHPIVHLVGRSEAFIYLDWFPEPEKVGQALTAGQS